MANSVTLSDLRTQALDLSDLTNSASPVTARVTDYVNAALGELWDILTTSFEDYVRSTSTITISAGTSAYSLPSDFYKAIKVFSAVGDDRYRLERFSLDEYDTISDPYAGSVTSTSSLRYRIMGNQILFAPMPASSGSVELWYVPQLTKLSGDSDTVHVSIPVGWEDFVALAAAVRLRIRDQQDASQLQALKQEARARILAAAEDRDTGEPQRITDVSYRFQRRRWR